MQYDNLFQSSFTENFHIKELEFTKDEKGETRERDGSMVKESSALSVLQVYF